MSVLMIVTQNNCPCQDAGAVRQHAMAKIFQELGWQVVVLGYGKHEGRITYDGVEYYSYRPATAGVLQRVGGRLMFGSRVLRHIKKHRQELGAILVVDLLPGAFNKIQSFADRNSIQLIHDSVEWYSPEEFTAGRRSVEYILKEYTNTKAIGTQWKVIGISQYLQNWFSGRCRKAIRVPVIMDIAAVPYRTDLIDANNKIKFVYAGSPSRKDYLAELLTGFSFLDDEQLKLMEIHLYGTNMQQLADVCGVSQQVLDKLEPCLNVHGRVPREQAVCAVADADYSMLLRDETLRYAKAGFPTKIVEALSCGTVPFCNLSSDLSMYLKDGVNAVLIDGHTSEAVAEAAKKAIGFSLDERIRMRQAARKTAEGHFDYRVYIDHFQYLLDDPQ